MFTNENAKLLLISKYSNITKQNRIRQYLQILTLGNVMDKKHCDVSEALEKIQNIITTYAPQGPWSYRIEEAKVEYLYNVVVGNEWCKIPLTLCFAHDPFWNFTSSLLL